MRSHLLEGSVRHRRARPVEYTLDHKVFYLALDLDELDLVDRSLRLFSWNRRNVVEFRDADHWPEPATDLRERVLAHLRAEGEDPAGWQITLITNPRFLGYVFNPASFYLCRDGEGALRIVVIEVHNTHLERHLYTLRPDAASPALAPGARFTSSMEKDFYVSPFIDIEGGYKVQVRDEPGQLRVAINERNAEGPLLSTSLVLVRRRLTNRSLLRALLRHPFMTQRTIGLIHVHAWRLWRRGLAFHRHGAAVTALQARRAGSRPAIEERGAS